MVVGTTAVAVIGDALTPGRGDVCAIASGSRAQRTDCVCAVLLGFLVIFDARFNLTDFKRAFEFIENNLRNIFLAFYPDVNLPAFLTAQNLKPFISNKLEVTSALSRLPPAQLPLDRRAHQV